MAKRKSPSSKQIDFPFYTYLSLFLKSERKKVYAQFKPLSRKILNFNNPENTNAFLRLPQFEALEIYVFLKEYCENEYLYEIFKKWYEKTHQFEGREIAGVSDGGQISMFGPFELTKAEDLQMFESVFKQIKFFKQIYPNYIFALTMGLGKTVLMATSIFYEFLLANKFPKDSKYCHNALVFAPDKTVLQSLREIETFDKSKVVPPEYVNWLESNLKFHFLDKTGDALNAIENSNFNIIISNTQKIILKKQHKEKSPSQALFEDYSTSYKALSLNKDYEDLYGFDINTDDQLITNQRFAKLTRLLQLGIYVDEAHHVFGNNLAKDFGIKKSATSLRVTINELAEQLRKAGTSVVGCYNYTGTPYVGSRLLPEVVYAYGLHEAIANKYLKKVEIKGFENIKDKAKSFIRIAITEFWARNKDKRFEKMLPKMALFASTVEELQSELKPAVEDVLDELGIYTSKILVNVGDPQITTNDDLREFKNLDTEQSEKQFILLVNKGKEGWNCRSLFGVALYRKPKSKVFVLQATMRCLRSIDPKQQLGQVFLSDENVKVLESELQENFKMSVEDLNNAADKKEQIEVRLVPPPVKIKFKRVRKLHQLKEKTLQKDLTLALDEAPTEKYKIMGSKRNLDDVSKKIGPNKDYSDFKDKRKFSEITLVSEISRYLNVPPLRIKDILGSTQEGLTRILSDVNEYNELLFDWIIPRLFNELYELKEFKSEEEIEVELVKEPKDGDCYHINANRDLVASLDDSRFSTFKDKSFHLDNYCFDSKPENNLFWTLLHDNKVSKVWFTGMLTHGQTDFVISYIDPTSHTVRSYYPDFLVQKENGAYVIVEVKGDNMIDDEVVKAKSEYATQMALASNMEYVMMKGSDANNGRSLN